MKLTQNRLLAALPSDERDRILGKADPISLHLKQVLYDVGEPVPYIYFPENGIVSLLVISEADGAAIEVATVGKEGLVGLPVFLGAVSIAGQACSQIPGDALRMRSATFKEEVSREGPFRRLMNLYTQTLFDQIAVSAACNRLHTMQQRCARWLLMSHDRVGSDQFGLTQEFLSQMLGVRRATVTIAVGALQEAGLIQYERGTIMITNRAGLEKTACACYELIKNGYERVMSKSF